MDLKFNETSADIRDFHGNSRFSKKFKILTEIQDVRRNSRLPPKFKIFAEIRNLQRNSRFTRKAYIFAKIRDLSVRDRPNHGRQSLKTHFTNLNYGSHRYIFRWKGQKVATLRSFLWTLTKYDFQSRAERSGRKTKCWFWWSCEFFFERHWQIPLEKRPVDFDFVLSWTLASNDLHYLFDWWYYSFCSIDDCLIW